MRTVSGIIALSCLVVFTACRPTPSVDEVRRAVSAHFEGRGYPVLELSVKDISPLATREKTYMGVPSFTVELDRIVLRVSGQEREFKSVRLLLKDTRAKVNRYTVSDISGVPLP